MTATSLDHNGNWFVQAGQRTIDKRRTRGEASRRLIVQAAIKCVATQGLSNTTLDRVAEVAGVSRALLVFHFKSKNGLLSEVLEFLGARYSEGWNVASATGNSAMERLLALLDYDVRFAADNPTYLSAWHAFWGESKGNPLYRQLTQLSFSRDQQYSGEIRELLAVLFEEGGYDTCNLAAAETAIFAMLFGFWVEEHLNPEPENYQNNMDAIRLVLRRLLPDHELPGSASVRGR